MSSVCNPRALISNVAALPTQACFSPTPSISAHSDTFVIDPVADALLACSSELQRIRFIYLFTNL